MSQNAWAVLFLLGCVGVMWLLTVYEWLLVIGILGLIYNGIISAYRDMRGIR